MLDQAQRKLVSNRLKSIEGHVRGVEKMVNEEAYCMDILKQIKAVHKALERVATITLESHLNTCVTTAIRSKDQHEKERVVNEIVEVFKAANKL